MIKSIIIMRKLFYWAFAFSLCVLMGCKDDGVRVEVVRYAINEPVFMSISEFRNSVKVTDEVVPPSGVRSVSIRITCIFLPRIRASISWITGIRHLPG